PLLTNGTTVPLHDTAGLSDVSRTHTHFETAIQAAFNSLAHRGAHQTNALLGNYIRLKTYFLAMRPFLRQRWVSGRLKLKTRQSSPRFRHYGFRVRNARYRGTLLARLDCLA